MGTGIILSMCSIAVGTACTEKILIAFGKTDYAQMVNIGGFSLVGVIALGSVINFVSKIKTVF